ncbi:MAG: LysR family transcriptional regulator [Bacteroidetes bacterium]|nr:LysR family transcriptional regulator [Bacteroidota bacterium]
MNYTLHQLVVFSKIVELKSITKASEELFMTQPAASIQLKNFQDQFEIPLTEVVGRQLYVTDFGQKIYKMAQNIITEVNAINYQTHAHKGLLSGKLSISIVSTGKYVMPFFLSDFLKQNPGIDLVMDVTNKLKVIESLEKNLIDFALVSVIPEKLNLKSEKLLENKLYVVGDKDFNNTQQLSSKQLTELPLIYREHGSGTRLVMQDYFSKHNLLVKKKFELTSNEAVKQAVIAGLGNSILPLIGIRNELITGELKIIPTVGFPITSNWELIWLSEKKLSPIAEAFVTFIKQNRTKILAEKFSWIDKIPNAKKKK